MITIIITVTINNYDNTNNNTNDNDNNDNKDNNYNNPIYTEDNQSTVINRALLTKNQN